MVVIRLCCLSPAYLSKPSLICDFCPSDQGFAYSFLQIPPHDGHPCCSAIHFPLPGHVQDFHLRERAHGAQTKRGAFIQHEVFISYHRNSSAELVEHIVAALESHGIKCWYAPRDVDSSYAGDIVKAINTCKVFLLVMNEQSSHSAHVLNEIDCAFNRFHQHESIRLLPFRTDNREISDDVRYYLGRIHFLDGTEPPEEDRINALVSRISYWIQSSEWNNNAQPVVQVQSIRSTTLVHNTNFVGRASELNEIYRLLHSDNNKLFLCGTGGIGKSELARQYGLKFQHEYRTILWFTYNSTLEDMIITDKFLLIHGLENEKQDLTTPQARETYYYKKLNYLKEHCDKHTLLIIDNFDAEDERTQELLEGPYSVIFTTRECVNNSV